MARPKKIIPLKELQLLANFFKFDSKKELESLQGKTQHSDPISEISLGTGWKCTAELKETDAVLPLSLRFAPKKEYGNFTKILGSLKSREFLEEVQVTQIHKNYLSTPAYWRARKDNKTRKKLFLLASELFNEGTEQGIAFYTLFTFSPYVAEIGITRIMRLTRDFGRKLFTKRLESYKKAYFEVKDIESRIKLLGDAWVLKKLAQIRKKIDAKSNDFNAIEFLKNQFINKMEASSKK